MTATIEEEAAAAAASEQLDRTTVLDQSWQEQSPIFTCIGEIGVAEYISPLPNLKSAFQTDTIVRCIDEGTPAGIHAAGSFILLPFHEAVQKARAVGATEITSHAGCGAAAIAYENLPDERKASYGSPDAYGKSWALQLAMATDTEYAGHISADEMKRPKEGHVARVIYYDGTGGFDYSQTEGLPPGFTISRRHVGPEQSIAETEVSIAIALGDHGFGNRITAENPLYIIPIGDPESSDYSVESLTAELQHFAYQSEGRVVIDGFSKPIAA